MRRKTRGGASLRGRPPLPMRLQVYAPGRDLTDDQARADYQAWEAERSAWWDQYRHLPVVEEPPGDEPFCGLLDEHDCTGVRCPQRPARAPIGGDDQR